MDPLGHFVIFAFDGRILLGAESASSSSPSCIGAGRAVFVFFFLFLFPGGATTNTTGLEDPVLRDEWLLTLQAVL